MLQYSVKTIIRQTIFRSTGLLNYVCQSLSTSETHNVKEKQIKVGDWNINYVKVGNGDHKVLFCPGAFGTIWTDGKPQVEGFDREKFTLVAWDPPGYGKSRPPDQEFPLDFYYKEADMAHKFMQGLGYNKYSLMGFSGGGIASLIHAATYNDAVHKLVVFGANAFLLPSTFRKIEEMQHMSLWPEKALKQFYEICGEEYFIELYNKWYRVMEAIFNERNGNLCLEKLKDIKCPTFILHGQKDPLVPYSHASYLNEHIANSRVHLYPEGLHHIHLQFPEDLNRRVQEFLLLQ